MNKSELFWGVIILVALCIVSFTAITETRIKADAGTYSCEVLKDGN